MSTVDPTSKRNTHHLKLSDGVNEVALLLADLRGEPSALGWQRANSPKSALKITSGNEGYGDFELPFSSIVQSDFSGGRGERDFEKDTTRYADGYRCDTTRANELRCGPAATQGSGYNSVYQTPAQTETDTLVCGEDATSEAGSFTTGGAIAVRSVNISVGFTNSSKKTQAIWVAIYAHNSTYNRPGSVLAQGMIALDGLANGLGSYDCAQTACSVDVNAALSGSTKYWLGLSASKYCTLIFGLGPSSGNKTMMNSFASWSDDQADKTIPFNLQTTGGGRSILFDYRGRKMAVTQSDDLTAPKLWMQGYHGLASSNSSDKSRLNTSLTLTANELIGKYARLVSGTGCTEETPWRKITGNTGGANAVISVAPNWNITHDTTTEFVIQGCTNWQELTSTAGSSTSMAIKSMSTYLTAPVTDVLVVDDAIYFAQGEGTNIARTRFNTGVWAEMAADGTNKATYLELVQDETGKKKIWAAARAAATIQEADKVSWGTSLTFAAALVCGDTSSQITGLQAAKIGGPMLPVVFKETEFGAVSGSGANKIYDTYYIFPEARDDFNGRGVVQPDMYLWFSLMDGIERYYDQRLDDTGPNRDEGLPKTRKGRVAVALKYFGDLFVAYDAGRYGYSSILRYNGVGWCEIYRAGYGRRIRSLNIDVLPELDNADRLWFSEEEDIYFVPICLNPDKVDNYTYFSGSQVETAWIYGAFKDLAKFWDSLAIFARNLTTNIKITAEYKVDNDDNAWTALPTEFITSPVQEVRVNTARTVTGKCIKFRLTLTTNNTAISPVITAIRINCVIRVKPKPVWNVTAIVSDGRQDDLTGVSSRGSVDTVVDQLEAWQDGTLYPAPLTASFFHVLNNGKMGFIDGVSTQPIVMAEENQGINVLIRFQFIEV